MRVLPLTNVLCILLNDGCPFSTVELSSNMSGARLDFGGEDPYSSMYCGLNLELSYFSVMDFPKVCLLNSFGAKFFV